MATMLNKYQKWFEEGGIPQLFIAAYDVSYLPVLGIDYSEGEKSNINTALSTKLPDLKENNYQSLDKAEIYGDAWYQFCTNEWKISMLQMLIKNTNSYIADWFVRNFIFKAYDTYQFYLTFDQLENNKFSLEINGQKHSFNGGINGIISQLEAIDFTARQNESDPKKLIVRRKNNKPEQPDPLPDDYIEPDYTNQYLMRLDNFESETGVDLEEEKTLKNINLETGHYGFLIDNKGQKSGEEDYTPRIGLIVYNNTNYVLRTYYIEDILNARYIKLKDSVQIIETPAQISEQRLLDNSLSNNIKIWSCLWGGFVIKFQGESGSYNPNKEIFDVNSKGFNNPTGFLNIGDPNWELPQSVSYSGSFTLDIQRFTLDGFGESFPTTNRTSIASSRWEAKYVSLDGGLWKIEYSYHLGEGSDSGRTIPFYGLQKNQKLLAGSYNQKDYDYYQAEYVKKYIGAQWKIDVNNNSATLFKDSQALEIVNNFNLNPAFTSWERGGITNYSVTYSGDHTFATAQRTITASPVRSPDFDNDWVYATIPFSAGKVGAVIDARFPDSICYFKLNKERKPSLSIPDIENPLPSLITAINNYLNSSYYQDSVDWLNELKGKLQSLKEFDAEKVEQYLDEFERKYYTILYNNFCGWEVIKKLAAGQTYFILAVED